MSEQTQAASSPAEVEDVFRGEEVSLDEFSKYRQSGELPARFKPAVAESAPADTPEETEKTEGDEPDNAPEPGPDAAQEPKPEETRADKRIRQLLAQKKELEARLAAKPDVKTESSPAQPQTAQNYKDWEKAFDAETWIEDYAKANPEAKYGHATAAMFSHMQDIRDQFRTREQQLQESQKALQGKLDEARSRYDDADTVIFPAAKTINDAQIPMVVKEVFAQSDLYIDLCYVVGSDPDELKKFVQLAQSNPRAAISKVFEYERGIQAELKEPDKAPEKKTSAPKPPTPVGGGSSRAFDVSDESLSADEWARKRTQQLEKRRG